MCFFLQHQQTLLNQLREVTGTTDVQLLQQALQVQSLTLHAVIEKFSTTGDLTPSGVTVTRIEFNSFPITGHLELLAP